MAEAYWLGFFTLPALAAAATLLAGITFRALVALERRGVTFEVKMTRDVDGISDYTLRHDIWWERSFGPVFVGGWYREPPRYQEPSPRLFTRWVGIGRTDGPALMAFRLRDLAPTHPAEQPERGES